MSLKIPTTMSDEEIQEFQKLYVKYFDISLKENEAQEKGLHFLQFLACIIDGHEDFNV